MDEKAIARFWSKVERGRPDECWPWTGRPNAGGYGTFYWGQNEALAHRVAFLVTHGRWPEQCGCHRCDNPPCCNPAHVFEGTRGENNTDRHTKGRSNTTRGEQTHNAALTSAQVLEIRATGSAVPQREQARRYGVTKSTIGRALRREKWKHI